MMKFDHLALPVSNLDRSREWYIATLGLKVEFEIPARHAVALQDGEGFAIFLEERADVVPNGIALWFQVDDVDKTFGEWTARGVAFAHRRRRISGDTAPSSSIPTATSCACGTSAR